MAEAARKQLYLTFKNLLASGEFSDLTVSCGGDSYKVHKNVVCSRADFFSRAVKFGGKETEEGIVDLPEDEPAIVKIMMQYIYEGEYDPALPDDKLCDSAKVTTPATPATPSAPSRNAMRNSTTKVIQAKPQLHPHSCFSVGFNDCSDPRVCIHHFCGNNCSYDCRGFTCSECYTEPVPKIPGSSEQLLVHTKLYEIADKYDVVGLKELVIEKFKRACRNFWNEPIFAAAAHHAFSTTPDHDKGLRDIVSQTIAAHMATLVQKPQVEALLTEFNGLAFGLLKMKTEAGWK